MLAPETDLFACGHKVYIPSPKTSSERNGRHFPPPASTESPLKTSKLSSPLHSHMKDLKKSLSFNDEVVTEISPHLLSYEKSKKLAGRSLFKLENTGVRTRSRTTNALIGRHNCRGDMKRHIPCNLSSSLDTGWTNRVSSPQPGWSASRAIPLSPSPTKRRESNVLTTVAGYRLKDVEPKDSTHNLIAEESSKLLYQRNSSQFLLSERIESPQLQDYLSELQHGARPVHQKMADQTELVLDNGVKFNTVVQELFPSSPRKWSAESEAGKKEKKITNVRGYRKWLDFPQPAQTREELQWKCREVSNTALSVSPPLTAASVPQTFSSQGPARNREFFEILYEWKTKWQINLQLKDVATRDVILTDLRNLCDITRMIALMSIALLAEADSSHSPQLQLYPSRSAQLVSKEKCVDEEMVDAVRRCLKDTAEPVRVLSAMILYCIGLQNKEVNDALLGALSGSSFVERWASVQTLARGGVGVIGVIEELLRHLTAPSSEENIKKASQLLISLSSQTSLVHSLLSEQLNCTGWMERLAACQVMSQLDGGINRDVCQKLLHMAWNDWSPEVRNGAAKALGFTGHGKLIHDEIGKRLTDSSETTRLDALKKLHSLGLMTNQLLPPYLSCFSDSHSSIRVEAVKMAGSLKLDHPKIHGYLLSLLANDPSWRVKTAVLQTVAECGMTDDEIVTRLVWVIRFEKLSQVRIEGCCTIAHLKLKQEKVITALKDLLTVEEDPHIKSAVSQTLDKLGDCGVAEDDMLNRVRSMVRQRGTQEAIKAEVLGADRTAITLRALQAAARPQLTTRDLLNYRTNGHLQQKVSHKNDETQSIVELKKTSTPVLSTDDESTHTHKFCDSPTGSQMDPASGIVELESSQDKSSSRKTWSPDRENIDKYLGQIRKSLESSLVID